MKTTLLKIKACSPCESGWTKLLASLGKTTADDNPLDMLRILESNGIDDALWALRAVDGYDREFRMFACDCADMVLPIYEKTHPNDTRVRDCIAVARRFANGDATDEERAAARDAAGAAWDAGAAARKWQTEKFVAMCGACE